MAIGMTVKGYADKVKCPTLLVTGEFDPLCPLEDAVEVYGDITARKEMWVIEDQFHPLWRWCDIVHHCGRYHNHSNNGRH